MNTLIRVRKNSFLLSRAHTTILSCLVVYFSNNKMYLTVFLLQYNAYDTNISINSHQYNLMGRYQNDVTTRSKVKYIQLCGNTQLL